MEIAIAQVGGDIEEYHRVARFTRKYLQNESDVYAPNSVSLSELLGDMFVSSSLFDFPWRKAVTKEVRQHYYKLYCDTPVRKYHENIKQKVPVQYFVALYEDELNEIYAVAANIIQKRVRGFITRLKMYNAAKTIQRFTRGLITRKQLCNPHCVVGRAFLMRLFETT